MREEIHIRAKVPGHLLTLCGFVSQTRSTIGYEHYIDPKAQEHVASLHREFGICALCVRETMNLERMLKDETL